jgi:hypothetical protein
MVKISEDIKEMLAYREMLSLLCFSINYSRRYERISTDRLSSMLDIPVYGITKACRLLERLGLANISRNDGDVIVEMLNVDDIKDEVMKNTIFEVVWENKLEFSRIYKGLIQGEVDSSSTQYN